MISGAEILAALREKDNEQKRLVITPLFDEQVQINQGSASIDLRLGSRFAVAKRRRLSHLRARTEELHPRQHVDEYYVPLGGKFVLHPNHFVLATTLEWIRLPPIYGAYVIGRSTYGRRGLIIATAAGVHPNYSGVITLELTNLAEIPLEIEPGQAVCQLFLHEVKTWNAEAVDRSSFAGSLYPTLGSLRMDEVDAFFGALDR